MQVAELAEGLEAPVQLVYLLTLLGFLVVGAYLVVRQVKLCGLSMYQYAFPESLVPEQRQCPVEGAD